MAAKMPKRIPVANALTAKAPSTHAATTPQGPPAAAAAMAIPPRAVARPKKNAAIPAIRFIRDLVAATWAHLLRIRFLSVATAASADWLWERPGRPFLGERRFGGTAGA